MNTFDNDDYNQKIDNELKKKELEKDKVLNRINQFLNSFDYFEIITNEIDEININKKQMHD